jgi:hypothetical protein
LNVNKILNKQGSLTDAYASQLTLRKVEQLQSCLTDFQTKKAKENLLFIQKKYDIAKMSFLKTKKEVTGTHSVKDEVGLLTLYRLFIRR